MELTIRDWMVIAGVLLIFAVLADAYRRVRKERKAGVRVKLVEPEESGSDRDAELAWHRELPNGGARVIERDDILRAAREHSAVEAGVPEQTSTAQAVVEEVELVTGLSASDEPQNIDWLEGLDKESTRLPRQVDSEVFMLNVVARSPAGFKGEDILHILLACDLRFGDMSFFHRHEQEAGRGPIQFSVANMMQPGVFDIDNMSDFNTPGLVFFLTLPGPEDMMQAFDYMMETAQAVARNLEGDVLDESRSVITRQTLEHSRQKIRDLERRLLAQAAN